MKLKRFGKRVLYLVGGILIVFFSSIFLAVYFDDGGRWYNQSAFYLYLAILFGLGLFISAFLKNMDSVKDQQKEPGDKPDETTVS